MSYGGVGAGTGGPGSGIERNLVSVRSRTEHLRYTISKLEHTLAWNPTVTWAELMGQFLVICTQLEVLNDEIQPMLEHFVSVPTTCTPNPQDIPTLLRTRDDPATEERIRGLLAKSSSRIETREVYKEQMDRHNEFIDTAEDSFKEMQDAFKKEIEVDRYAVKQEPSRSADLIYQYIDTGK